MFEVVLQPDTADEEIAFSGTQEQCQDWAGIVCVESGIGSVAYEIREITE